MVLAATGGTQHILYLCLLFTTVSAIWNYSYPDDDYKHYYRERHKLGQNETRSIIQMRHRTHRNKRHQLKHDSTYSLWSDWEDCDRVTCTQSRSRICLKHSLCHGSIQSETRRCNIHDCKLEEFRQKGNHTPSPVVKIINIDVFENGNNSYKQKHDKIYNNDNTKIGIQLIRQRYNRIIKSNNEGQKRSRTSKSAKVEIVRKHEKRSMLRLIQPGRSTRGYSKWSLWSPCSKHCLTVRRRKCMRRRVCGRNVIKERAYCYIENSNCQEWVRHKIQDSKTKFIFETINSRDMADLPNDFEHTNMISHGDSRTESVQCGVLYGNKSSKMRSNLWSMMRIIGGRPSPKGKWVWQVVILNRFKEAFCGGTLISLRWVLTAAHCVRKRLYVRIGEYSLSKKDDQEVEMQIKEAVIHPYYNPETVDNDVAMLRLPQAARPNRGHGVVCLPRYHQPLPAGRLCTIIGWGKRRSTDNFGTDTLHEAEVPIIPMETCRNTYVDYYITNNMFCAGYRRGRMDSCAGDSGGPLLCKDPTKAGEPWTIYGITSFGDGCGKKGKYGIYTRLPNYVNWINKVLKIAYFHD